jgi:uridine kinase
LWVLKYQGKNRKLIPKPQGEKTEDAPLSNDVKLLQQELRKVQLHNKFLNAVIDIAEEQLHIDIRKKAGTKR